MQHLLPVFILLPTKLQLYQRINIMSSTKVNQLQVLRPSNCQNVNGLYLYALMFTLTDDQLSVFLNSYGSSKGGVFTEDLSEESRIQQQQLWYHIKQSGLQSSLQW